MMLPVALSIFILAVSSASAQTTFATVTGTITDTTGAAIPGATVTATHTESNYRYTATSNSNGGYTVPQLLEGEYTLRIQAPGFKEFVVTKLTLVSLDNRRVDARL
jgi:hypothetical protein